MPILKREATLLPEDLLENEWSAEDAERPWLVVHTKPRAEKTLARRLAADGTPFFLPLYEQRPERQERVKSSFKPLFPGYVFVRANEDERIAVWSNRSVANCLRVPDQADLHGDLQRVHRLVESKAFLAPEERLQLGMSAEIVSGPLKGHRGKVVRKGRSLRFVIEVNFLQQGASVEVNSTDVRPV